MPFNTVSKQMLCALAAFATMPATFGAPTNTLKAPLPSDITCNESQGPTIINTNNISTWVQELIGSGMGLTVSPADPIFGGNVRDTDVGLFIVYDTTGADDHRSAIQLDPTVIKSGFMAIFDKCHQDGQTFSAGGNGISTVLLNGDAIEVGWTIV